MHKLYGCNIRKSGDAGWSFHLLAISLQCFLYCFFFPAVPVRIRVLPFHRAHLLFLGSSFLNNVTLRCNSHIMCITRITGCFSIMHTVKCFCQINKQSLFWSGTVHWFRTIFLSLPAWNNNLQILLYWLKLVMVSWLWERCGQQLPGYRALCLLSWDA